MNMRFIIARLHAFCIRYQLLCVEAQQRDAISELIFSIDYRIYAQKCFSARSQRNANRKATLQQQLDAIEKELG